MQLTKTPAALAALSLCAATAQAAPISITHQGRFTSVNGAAETGNIPTEQQFSNLIDSMLSLFDPTTAQAVSEGFGRGLSIRFTDDVFGDGTPPKSGVTFSYTIVNGADVSLGLLDLLPDQDERIEIAQVKDDKFQAREAYGQVQQQAKQLTDPGPGGSLNEQVWELTFITNGALPADVIDIINGGPDADLTFNFAVVPSPATAAPLLALTAARRRRRAG